MRCPLFKSNHFQYNNQRILLFLSDESTLIKICSFVSSPLNQLSMFILNNACSGEI